MLLPCRLNSRQKIIHEMRIQVERFEKEFIYKLSWKMRYFSKAISSGNSVLSIDRICLDTFWDLRTLYQKWYEKLRERYDK